LQNCGRAYSPTGLFGFFIVSKRLATKIVRRTIKEKVVYQMSGIVGENAQQWVGKGPGIQAFDTPPKKTMP